MARRETADQKAQRRLREFRQRSAAETPEQKTARRAQETEATRQRELKRTPLLEKTKIVDIEPGQREAPTPAEIGEQFLRAQPTPQFEARRKAQELAGQRSADEYLSRNPDRIPEDDE